VVKLLLHFSTCCVYAGDYADLMSGHTSQPALYCRSCSGLRYSPLL